MGKYITKRILISIPLMIAVVLVVFLMLQVLPGNPITVMMGEKASPAVIERVTEQMGLNDPVMVRFGRYILDACQGDLGISYKLNRPITGLIMEAFPNTVKLAIAASLVAWIIGIPAGICHPERHPAGPRSHGILPGGNFSSGILGCHADAVYLRI